MHTNTPSLLKKNNANLHTINFELDSPATSLLFWVTWRASSCFRSRRCSRRRFSNATCWCNGAYCRCWLPESSSSRHSWRLDSFRTQDWCQEQPAQNGQSTQQQIFFCYYGCHTTIMSAIVTTKLQCILLIGTPMQAESEHKAELSRSIHSGKFLSIYYSILHPTPIRAIQFGNSTHSQTCFKDHLYVKTTCL